MGLCLVQVQVSENCLASEHPDLPPGINIRLMSVKVHTIPIKAEHYKQKNIKHTVIGEFVIFILITEVYGAEALSRSK